MHRRNALKKTILLAGAISIAPELLAKALADPGPILQNFPAVQLELLAELVDTILPTTDSPGAKAAGVQEFIVLAVEACFSANQRDSFWSALNAADQDCQKTLGKAFAQCTEAERIQFLHKLEDATAPAGEPQFFQVLKELTLHGYFTSEIGATKALNYDPIPGVWIPDMPIDGNTKAWTPMF